MNKWIKNKQTLLNDNHQLKKERKKERKKHMDNEYRGKTYVTHFLTTKDSLRDSVIKLGYP